MKCSVPRCPQEAVARPRGRGEMSPPELALCDPHRTRYSKEYRKHFAPMYERLAKGSKRRISEDIIQAWAKNGNAREKSWVATWLQMVDLEVLNEEGTGLGAQRGSWKTVDGVETWVAEGVPSAPGGLKQIVRQPLPEQATRAGQAAIAKRAAEEDLVKQQLEAEVAEFARGQRLVLLQELKMKRELEAKKAKAKS